MHACEMDYIFYLRDFIGRKALMKISTKSRYALRIMVYLAENYPLGYISLKNIADKEDLPMKYTEQLIGQLVKAGYLETLRGNHGGYKLAQTPENYTVNQIVKVMEVFKTITPCANPINPQCDNVEKCVVADIWQLLQSTIDELLDNITLLDILKLQEGKLNKSSLYLTFLDRKMSISKS